MNLPYSDDLRSFSIFFLFSERKDVDVEIGLYAAALNENERTLLISIIHLMFVLSAYHFEEQVGFAPYSWRDPFHAPWKLLDIYSVIIFSAAAISDVSFSSSLFFSPSPYASFLSVLCGRHSFYSRLPLSTYTYISVCCSTLYLSFFIWYGTFIMESPPKKIYKYIGRWGGEVFAINFALGPRAAAATDISSLRLYGGREQEMMYGFPTLIYVRHLTGPPPSTPGNVCQFNQSNQTISP